MTPKQEIEQELKEISPVLASLRKPIPPEAPAGYFLSFSDQLIQDIREQEVKQELQAIAPVLATASKPEMVEVPANYFRDFSTDILKKVNQAAVPVQPSWRESFETSVAVLLSRVFKPQFSAAFAGFATLMLVAVMLFYKVEQCTDFECKLAKLTNEDLNGYVASHPDEFYTDVLDYSVSDKKILKQQEKANQELDKLFNSIEPGVAETSILD